MDSFILSELPTEPITSSVTKIIDFSEPASEDLTFLINRNEKNQSIVYSLLDTAYNLQFPQNPIQQTTHETEELEETGHIDDPEGPEDYWLDSERTVEALGHLDLIAIYENLANNRPFVTLVSLREAIIEAYQRYIFNLSKPDPETITEQLMTEYLERFFSGLGPGCAINLAPPEFLEFSEDPTIEPTLTSKEFILEIVKNRYHQIVVVPKKSINRLS